MRNCLYFLISILFLSACGQETNLEDNIKAQKAKKQESRKKLSKEVAVIILLDALYRNAKSIDANDMDCRHRHPNKKIRAQFNCSERSQKNSGSIKRGIAIANGADWLSLSVRMPNSMATLKFKYSPELNFKYSYNDGMIKFTGSYVIMSSTGAIIEHINCSLVDKKCKYFSSIHSTMDKYSFNYELTEASVEEIENAYVHLRWQLWEHRCWPPSGPH